MSLADRALVASDDELADEADWLDPLEQPASANAATSAHATIPTITFFMRTPLRALRRCTPAPFPPGLPPAICTTGGQMASLVMYEGSSDSIHPFYPTSSNVSFTGLWSLYSKPASMFSAVAFTLSDTTNPSTVTV